mmetsp:Transcript_18870/g.44795  ORF Transcript_18870/g.44795 Transcript_18870/m.44795 type:complete len:104 (+) Transcript_18870:572-883(+)
MRPTMSVHAAKYLFAQARMWLTAFSLGATLARRCGLLRASVKCKRPTAFNSWLYVVISSRVTCHETSMWLAALGTCGITCGFLIHEASLRSALLRSALGLAAT